MNNFEEILFKMESSSEMEIYPPAPASKVKELEESFPKQAEGLKDLYAITNGIGIDMSSIEIYSVEKVLSLNNDVSEDETIEIGRTGFGDIIVADNSGMILQIDHELEEVFLECPNLEEFLVDELEALKS